MVRRSPWRCAATRPDAVIHQLTDLAAMREPGRLDDALHRNAELRKTGTANLVTAARGAGVERMVAQSIGWIYRAGTEPHDEDAPLDVGAAGTLGVSVAGVVALEHAVLATPGLRGCVLRYGQLYGPGTGNADARSVELPLHVEAAAWGGGAGAREGGGRRLQRRRGQRLRAHRQGPARARLERFAARLSAALQRTNP